MILLFCFSKFLAISSINCGFSLIEIELLDIDLLNISSYNKEHIFDK